MISRSSSHVNVPSFKPREIASSTLLGDLGVYLVLRPSEPRTFQRLQGGAAADGMSSMTLVPHNENLCEVLSPCGAL